MRLKNKVAVVTGAGAGIGRAAAEAFRAEGADVWAADLDSGALAAFADIKALPLDLRDDAAVNAAFAHIGRVDVLFNCVGAVPGGTVLETDAAAFASAFDINVLSMVRTIRAALPGMAERGAGSIINMSSVASSVTGVPNRCAYGTTKAAVVGLTKSVAADFVARGVRCNAICPGTVDTPSLRQRAAAQGDLDAAMAKFVARQPMGRLGRAEEVAALALYLAADEAAFVTGQTFVIDGGWTI